MVSENSLKNLTYRIPKGNIPWNKGLIGRIGIRNGDYKKCEICNGEYYIKKCQSNKRRTCSHKCSSILKSKEKSKENHWNWKGGITSINSLIRNSKEYKDWAMTVYKRDFWTCQKCNKKCNNRNIIAHHIKNFSDYIKLRFEINNGMTFCRSCHMKIHYQELLFKRLNKIQYVY